MPVVQFNRYDKQRNNSFTVHDDVLSIIYATEVYTLYCTMTILNYLPKLSNILWLERSMSGLVLSEYHHVRFHRLMIYIISRHLFNFPLTIAKHLNNYSNCVVEQWPEVTRKKGSRGVWRSAALGEIWIEIKSTIYKLQNNNI